MNFLIRNWWKITLLLFAVISVIAIAALMFAQDHGFANLDSSSLEPVPAPEVSGKIKGYWSSMSNNIFDELDDAEEMKAIGINTVTFSPALQHTAEGNVTETFGQEAYVKRSINKAHLAGLRVMLETTPMNAGNVPPRVTNPKLFQEEMGKMAVKYAKIAEEYDVEFFSPIVEPAHHMSVSEADEWLHRLLPELKSVYSGPIMWKKQAMHLQNPKEFNKDHIMEMEFTLDNFDLQLGIKSLIAHQMKLNFQSNELTLMEYENGSEKFSKKINANIKNNIKYVLRVEIENKEVRIYLDDELMISHTDDSGPMGGYSLGSRDGAKVSKFEITDMTGNTIVKEDFKSFVNWGVRNNEWKIDEDHFIIKSHSDTPLLHDIDFSGYDYLAIDTFKRGQVETNAKYIENLEYIVDKTNEQAKLDGVPNVIIAEFGGSIEKNIDWIDVDHRAKIPMTEDELAEVTQMVLEMAENKVDGYMYNGWDIEGQGLNKMPKVKKVIKDWYLRH